VPEILVVLLLFIYPFLHGLVLSFEPKEGGGLANYLRFFSQPFFYNTIATTLRVAGVSGRDDDCLGAARLG
jgi:putative spermidine/putrescine transport system permease protein